MLYKTIFGQKEINVQEEPSYFLFIIANISHFIINSPKSIVQKSIPDVCVTIISDSMPFILLQKNSTQQPIRKEKELTFLVLACFRSFTSKDPIFLWNYVISQFQIQTKDCRRCRRRPTFIQANTYLNKTRSYATQLQQQQCNRQCEFIQENFCQVQAIYFTLFYYFYYIKNAIFSKFQPYAAQCTMMMVKMVMAVASMFHFSYSKH